jgi:hypothetical protein
MTTIDISNRFTPEIMNSKAGKRLCFENPNTNIDIHHNDYTVLSQAKQSPLIPFEHALFHKGHLCCISLARSNDVDFRNIQKIQKRETGIRVFIFPQETYHDVRESDDDCESDISDTFVIPPSHGAAPQECNHEVQWNIIPIYPPSVNTANTLKDFINIYQEQFQYILNNNRCYMMTLQYPKIDHNYEETKLFIDETYYMEPNQIVLSSNQKLHDRIREFKEYSIQRPILEHPKEYPVPHCVSLFQWFKYRFFQLPGEQVTIFHGSSHKSFISKCSSQKSTDCICCINIEDYSNNPIDDKTKVHPIPVKIP